VLHIKKCVNYFQSRLDAHLDHTATRPSNNTLKANTTHWLK